MIRTASFRVKPDRIELVETVVNRFVEAVAEGEPGTRLYLSLRNNADPTAFLQLMIFEDAAAEAAHAGTEWVKRFTAGLYPNLVGGVSFTGYSYVAGAPLDPIPEPIEPDTLPG